MTFSRQINYESELNPEQLAVVRGAEGASLALAGAGSGKTRTIVYRVAYLLERGILPREILLLTFTNKAAKEMLSRVHALLGARPQGLVGGTFHSVANRLLRFHASAIGYGHNFSILDEDDSRGLIKLCLKEAAGNAAAGKNFPSPAVAQNIWSFKRNSGRTVEETIELKCPKFLDTAPVIERVATLYEAKKRAANAMDFDDLLLNLLAVLRQSELLRRQIAGQFKYVLVDEFQDTNIIQAALVKEFASVHGNILVVGDDAQSIYSFRAANIGNILNFSKIFSAAKIFYLTTNYRSTPEILGLANDVIAKNHNQFQKELRPAVPSFVKPEVAPCANELKEADWVVKKILSLRETGVPFSKIAVLFRATFHSQALEFELTKRGIEYEYRGGVKFFERAHIKDVLAFLRIKANVKDEAAWQRVLGLMEGIGAITAQKIFAALVSAASFEEVCRLPLESALGEKAAHGWRECADILRRLNSNEPSELIREVVNSRYTAYLEAEYTDYEERLADLEQLARAAGGANNLSDFLAEACLYDEYGFSEAGKSARYAKIPSEDFRCASASLSPQSGEPCPLDRRCRSQDLPASTNFGGEGRLILSTVHQAKGLEWDAVFVIHLTEDGFPNSRAVLEDGGLEEERRLFYVAATRARKWLFLTYPVISGRDFSQFSGPSLFLEELNKKLIKESELRHSPISYLRAVEEL